MTSEIHTRPPYGGGVAAYSQTLGRAPALPYSLRRAWREYAATVAALRRPAKPTLR